MNKCNSRIGSERSVPKWGTQKWIRRMYGEIRSRPTSARVHSHFRRLRTGQPSPEGLSGVRTAWHPQTIFYLTNDFLSFREDPSADPSEILPQNPSAESFHKCLFRIENPSAESFRKDPSVKIGQQKTQLFFWILPQPSAKSFRGTFPQMLILHWKSFRGILPQNPSAKINKFLTSLWDKIL